ncbi:MAG: acetyl-CoA carboxylase biotin carboxyl carrier protein [Verrucomicrobiaceae bacterium]|nr:acetyl-CoA carboxylase biotin carboxyl carrier protein [Verrucomicrobiaceae bacterium]
MAVTRRNHKPDADENPDPELDISKIKDCIKLMDEHELTGLELEQQGFKVKLERGGVVAQASRELPQAPADTQPEPAPEAIVAEETNEITAPMVGTFYKASSPDSDPFVKVGDAVDEDTTVCIIEAMKVMNEIKAEKSGVIQRILIDDASSVQFGQGLFIIA